MYELLLKRSWLPYQNIAYDLLAIFCIEVGQLYILLHILLKYAKVSLLIDYNLLQRWVLFSFPCKMCA